MQQKKIILLSATVVLLIGFFVFLRGKDWFVGQKSPMTLEERLDADQVLLNDFVNSKTVISKNELEDGSKNTEKNTERYAIYEAVLRLSRTKKPIAMKAALTMAGSADKMWREAAAQALSNYNDEEAFKKLMELTNDSEDTVRQTALKNMGKVQTPERARYIEQMLKEKNISQLDKVDLYGSLYMSSEDSVFRNLAQESLLTMARRKGGREENDEENEVADAAALKLIQVAPRWDETIKLLQDLIKTTKNERVLSHAVKLLSARNDPWVQNNLSDLLKHESSLVRKVTIQSLHSSCPAQRWDLLSDVVKTETARERSKQDRSVLETLVREATLLAGPSAVSLLNEIMKKEIHEQVRALTTESLNELQKNPKPGPCG